MKTIQPTKEQVRQWLVERRQGDMPPPNADAIRHQLGWKLVRCAGAPFIQQASLSDEHDDA